MLAGREARRRGPVPVGMVLLPPAHLIDVTQQIGRIVVDAVGSGALWFIPAVAAGQYADP